ncbi:hypothetical protein GBW32_24495 [Streptomyces tsukubensis]|uniref:Integral membrane protein n=2 Tax=Streptomyces tsukubensis TaxID=83656 RepID=A0A1V4AD77_9ACTN|nr:hypothetical protein B1H18_07950 [Streptomyces tsukubensis]QFR98000.1 hypothetical protein GBW32_24495 [Streptomyces tsukubensis]
MEEHRAWCERAVDPLEIAAGLEAHGITDRAVARYRHRTVFSLAEEMYARLPQDDDHDIGTSDTGHAGHPAPDDGHERGRGTGWAVLVLLPAALCALTLAGAHLASGGSRLAVIAAGAPAVALAVRACLRHGPLVAPVPGGPAARLRTCGLLAYACYGDGLIDAALTGGPDEPWPPHTAPLLALCAAVAPAAWCAGFFAVRARHALRTSRGLDDFAASVWPPLLGALAVHLCLLGALLGLSGALLGQATGLPGAGALGLLLFLARLLMAHGVPVPARAALGAAFAAEVLAVCSVFIGRLPECAFLAVPVENLTSALGAGAVPALACSAAALPLLVHALSALTKASAHLFHDGGR